MAGIQIVGAIGIRVKPDLSGFREELKAALGRVDYTVGVKVKPLTSEASAELAAWQRQQEAKDIEKTVSLDRSALGRASNLISSFGDSAARSLTKTALGITTVVSAFSAMSSIGPLLASTAGVAGLLPGALLAAGAALAAVKLGVEGIKKAFSSAVPAVNDLKTAVSSTFERTLVPGVNAARAALPQLTSGFQNVATSLSGIANSTLIAFNTQGIKAFQAILDQTSTIFTNLGKAVAPLALAFLNVAKIGGEMFAPMTAGAGLAAQKILDFTTSAAGIEKIRGFIQGGIDAFRVLGEIVGTVWSIIKQVVSAFSSVGGSLGAGILGPLKTLDSYLKTLEGQTVLRQLADGFKQVADAVNRVLKQALESLGPAIGPAADALGKFAGYVADVLVPALEAAGPVIKSVFEFLSDNMGWVAPLALGVYAAAKAFGVLRGVMIALNLTMSTGVLGVVLLVVAALVTGAVLVIKNWDTIKAFFERIFTAIGRFVESVMTSIGHFFQEAARIATTAFKAVGEFFSTVFSAIGDVIRGIVDVVKVVFTTVVEVIKTIFTPVVEVIQGIIDVLVEIFTVGWNVLSTVVKTAWDLIIAVINIAVAIVVGIFQTIYTIVVETFTPIFDFISYIFTKIWDFIVMVWDAILAALKAVWDTIVSVVHTVFEGVAEFLSTIWNGISDAVSVAWNFITDVISTAVHAVSDVVTSVWNSIADFLSGVWNSISGAVRSAWNSISDFLSSVLSSIGGFFRDRWNGIVNFLSDAWSRMRQATTDAWNNVMDFLRGIPGRIADFFSGLPGRLYEIGKAILNGLFDGLKQVWSNIQSFFSGIGGWIADHKGPITYDKRLLIPHGNAIMDGFFKGLQKAYSPVQGFITGVGSDIADSMTKTAQGINGISLDSRNSSTLTLEAGNSLEERISAALTGWGLNIDPRGVGYLSKKGNSLNATR